MHASKMSICRNTILVIFILFASRVSGSELVFKALVNGQPLSCNEEYKAIGAEKVNMIVNDFRLYISKVEVKNKNGKWSPAELLDDSVWQSKGIVLLDFENGRGSCLSGSEPTNHVVKIKQESVSDDITGLRFEVGIPFHLNHIDPISASAPLNTTAMFWSWQNGYKFIKLDARFSTEDKNTKQIVRVGFPVHIGSTMCVSGGATIAPSECKNPNRVRVQFDDFNNRNHQIGIDVGKLLSDTQVMRNTAGTPAGCMSFPNDPDCDNIMKNLGLPYQHKAGAQKLFILLTK